MRLIAKVIDKTGIGYISLIPEEPEDLWHVYNLITVGDSIRANTVRKVVREKADTGSTDTKERKRVTLTIKIQNVDFDPVVCSIRVRGKNIEENKFVKLGAFHTIELELHKKFTLNKEYWDPISLERVTESCDVSKRAEVAALLIDEGLANLCLLTEQMTIVRARIEVPIPRKRKASQQGHDKGVEKFFSQTYDAVVRHVDFKVVKCFIISGPGFTKDQFNNYMTQKAQAAQTPEDKTILENRSKLLIISASSAHKHSLKEVLEDKVVLEKMQDTKAAKEVQELNRFFSTLNSDPTKATYGLKSVKKANDQAAIESLLISDSLFRSQSINTRKMYVTLVEQVRENGGDVRVFSSMHVSGARLEKMTGVAAILRFPLPGLDDSDSEEEKEASEEEEIDSIEENDEGEDNEVIQNIASLPTTSEETDE